MSSIKQVEVASAALTITLASLASDNNLLTGRQSSAVSNASNLYLDYHLSGKIMAGTSPAAAKVIEVWVYPALTDTPTYPDATTGSDGGISITSRDILAASCALAASMVTDATSNRTYYFRPVSVAQLFGGKLPPAFGVFVVHNTGVALNATGGNHAIYVTGKYASVA